MVAIIPWRIRQVRIATKRAVDPWPESQSLSQNPMNFGIFGGAKWSTLVCLFMNLKMADLIHLAVYATQGRLPAFQG